MSRSSHATGLRPFVVNRNICNFLWYGVVEGGLRAKVLGRLGCPSPTKSVCSILPIARHLRAGDVFCVSTPARRSAPPDALSSPPVRLCPRTQAHNTRRYEHPSPASLALSGWGYAELRRDGVLGSTQGPGPMLLNIHGRIMALLEQALRTEAAPTAGSATFRELMLTSQARRAERAHKAPSAVPTSGGLKA
jgi:hypothetical protein